MRFQLRREEPAEINLTPLIDVVFLLLIFFMVTTTFNRYAELRIDLPKASAQPTRPPKATELVVDADGRYYLDGRALVNTRLETLVRALRELRTENPEAPLVIRADARTTHQSVVTAMDAAGRIGIRRLSIVTTQADRPSTP